MAIPRPVAQGIVLVVVAAILGTQLIIGFAYRGKRTWPIIAYPMYRTPHFEGERLDHDWTTVAIFKDGRETEVDREDLGMEFWIYYKNVVNGVIRGHTGELQPVAARYCDRGTGEVVTLEVRDLGVEIARSGPVYGLEPKTVAATTVPCPEQR